MAKTQIKRSKCVWISVDSEETATLNYNEKLENVGTVLSCWKYRSLTDGQNSSLSSLIFFIYYLLCV